MPTSAEFKATLQPIATMLGTTTEETPWGRVSVRGTDSTGQRVSRVSIEAYQANSVTGVLDVKISGPDNDSRGRARFIKGNLEFNSDPDGLQCGELRIDSGLGDYFTLGPTSPAKIHHPT